MAKWSDGTEEYRVTTNSVSSVGYDLWVKEMRGAYDVEHEEYEYDYDAGIAP